MKLVKRVSGSILLLFFILLSCCMFAFVTGCGGSSDSGGGGGYNPGSGGGGGTTTGVTISSVTSNITPGSRCIINGSGFGATGGSGSTTNFVSFTSSTGVVSGNPYMYDSWTSTQIICYVNNLTPGETYVVRVTVGADCSTASGLGAGVNQIVIATPVNIPHIDTVVPTTAAAGSNVTINGTNFGNLQGNSFVYYQNGSDWKYYRITNTYVSWSDTSIVITLPTGLVSGTSAVLYVHTDTGGTSNGIGPTIQ